MDQQAIEQNQPKAADLLRSVLARSATDAAYRQRLLTNPREAITEVTGHPLPPDYQVAFVENKADVTLVLPKLVKAAELNEGDLDTVSGGTEVIASIIGTIVATATVATSTDKWQAWWDKHTPEQKVITDEMMNAAPAY